MRHTAATVIHAMAAYPQPQAVRSARPARPLVMLAIVSLLMSGLVALPEGATGHERWRFDACEGGAIDLAAFGISHDSTHVFGAWVTCTRIRRLSASLIFEANPNNGYAWYWLRARYNSTKGKWVCTVYRHVPGAGSTRYGQCLAERVAKKQVNFSATLSSLHISRSDTLYWVAKQEGLDRINGKHWIP